MGQTNVPTDHIDLIPGPNVLSDPNSIRLSVGASGLQASVNGGTPAKVGGGDIVPWFSNVAAFVQGLQPTLLVATLRTDVVSFNIELELSTAAGSGAATIVTTSPGGIGRSATGATGSSFRSIRNKGNVGEPVIGNIRTMKWAIATKFKVVQTQTACFHRLVNTSDEATADSGLCLDFSVSTTNYCLKAGTASAIDLGVAFDTTAWHTGLVIGDGTNLKAYIGASDGTGLTQIGASAAQSTCPNAAGDWSFFPSNNATTANNEGWVDAALVLTERA